MNNWRLFLSLPLRFAYAKHFLTANAVVFCMTSFLQYFLTMSAQTEYRKITLDCGFFYYQSAVLIFIFCIVIPFMHDPACNALQRLFWVNGEKQLHLFLVLSLGLVSTSFFICCLCLLMQELATCWLMGTFFWGYPLGYIMIFFEGLYLMVVSIAFSLICRPLIAGCATLALYLASYSMESLAPFYQTGIAAYLYEFLRILVPNTHLLETRSELIHNLPIFSERLLLGSFYLFCYTIPWTMIAFHFYTKNMKKAL